MNELTKYQDTIAIINMKYMRLFFEEWVDSVEQNRHLPSDETMFLPILAKQFPDVNFWMKEICR